MSNANPTAAPQQPAFVTYFEQYHCPACDGAIARECVAANVEKGTLLPRRTVKVWCEHCRRLFQASFDLNCGTWQLDGRVAEIADPRQTESFEKRIAHVRGDVLQTATT